MTHVEIEYCVPCGHLDRAVDTQRHLLELLGRNVETVALRPGDGGVFEVRVDGETVFDKDDEAYDLDSIAERVSERA
ncbi:SelT/SelW/SelH family protein [Halorarius halobius]|uniref:SelT/SelW/SelH family protein n=1 Tax=Halorarius halobius TaxID=2962671 RepID=UPI0020CB781A|nr:Rdx family protein [Halorarius halobius]